MTAPVREWVTFPDPKRKKHVWHFDVTFLTSNYMCIFGQGCQGVLAEKAPEQARGLLLVRRALVGREGPQARRQGRRPSSPPRTGSSSRRVARRASGPRSGRTTYRTRLVDDACIFLNRPGFDAGAGCALHIYAMRTGVHHSDVKPEVCWQVPLRNIEEYDEDANDGIVHHRLTEFARHGWGEGGDEFAWWCTEAPEAFVGTRAGLPQSRSRSSAR